MQHFPIICIGQVKSLDTRLKLNTSQSAMSTVLKSKHSVLLDFNIKGKCVQFNFDADRVPIPWSMVSLLQTECFMPSSHNFYIKD